MLGKFEETVLLGMVICRGTRHVRNVVDALRANGLADINAGAVQKTMGRLVDKGLLCSSKSETELIRDRPRKVYSLTNAGRVALNRSVLASGKLVAKARETGHSFTGT